MRAIITIKGSKPINLEFQLDDSSTIKFIHDSVDNALSYDANSYTGLEFTGVILKENKAAILELLKWSLMTEGKDIYRPINVKLSSTDDILREYDFPEMFVVDYRETFKGEDSGNFKLTLNQRGKTDKVKVF